MASPTTAGDSLVPPSIVPDPQSKGNLHLSDEVVQFDPASSISRVFFDNASEQLFSIRSGGVTGVVVKGPTEDRSCSFTMDDKGEILSVKLSPDQAVMAIQRSRKSVEFINRPQDFATDTTAVGESGRPVEYSQACKAKSASVIGFAWTGFGNDIIFVTDQSVELFEVQPQRKCLRYIKLYTMQVNWFIYQPQTCYLLVSSGILGNVLHPIFFSGPGMCTRHSKFEVDLPVVPKPPKLCLFDRDVSLCKIYSKSRVVVLRHRGTPAGGQSGAAEVVVYTIDGTMLPRKTNILKLDVSGRFAINFIDNLIIVHHQSSKTSQIFDIGMGCLPETNIQYHSPLVPPAEIVCKGNHELYSANWVVFPPNIIIDAKMGLLWRLMIDLDKLSQDFEKSDRLIEFVLQRKDNREVLLKSIKRIILSTPPLAKISSAMNKIANLDGISEDLVCHVFKPLVEKLDQTYMFSVLVEHMRTKEVIGDSLRDIMVSNLIKRNKFYQLHQFLQYHILGDSKPLANQLLALASEYPPAQQLALDMLYRVGCSQEETIEALLTKGKVISALKVVQSQGNQDTVSARKFLEGAKQTGDPAIFYSVYRFFVQRNINLRGNETFPKGEMCQQYVTHYNILFGESPHMLTEENHEL
ncbi:hypothetical protein BIW11_02080 [Tropilaelaps mercedesae]|uniref:Uncharacterized protein n=1 Tax=Tropilaelaps mercedesae TaxID=418985 RepID=A0A1V9X3T8_9ACAR|nr:hypothetical protein BIW11_02080 [Tropilaelaps mercedesae]